MELYRSIIEDLKAWKDSPDRRPLILKGARKTGKTWILEYFGRTEFEHVAIFNFDKDKSLNRIFENTQKPEKIIPQLKLRTDSPILPQKTLLIFDEIQECHKALKGVRHFYRDAPEYAVVATGLLLGTAFPKSKSLLTGKVEFMNLYPLTFKEFLKANDEKIYRFVEELSAIEPLPQITADKLKELYQQYLIVGGMPAAVKAFMENNDIKRVKLEQRSILSACILDFHKYADNNELQRIIGIWNSIPSQHTKEYSKFIYTMVDPRGRTKDYENALLWLENAGLIYRIFRYSKLVQPRRARSIFKIHLVDIGLLRELAGLPPEALLFGNAAYPKFKKVLVDNYILQSLVCQLEFFPKYWGLVRKIEIDYVIGLGTDLIPIEIKSDTYSDDRSMSAYDANFQPAYKLRYSLDNLNMDDNLINIPLYLADWTTKLVSAR